MYRVENLTVAIFRPERGMSKRQRRLARQERSMWVDVVRDASYSIEPGEVLALVGESAAGKSLMLLGALNLVGGGAKVVGGTTTFDGKVLLDADGTDWVVDEQRMFHELDEAEWRRTVGTGIGLMTQDPIAAFDPLEVVGDQSGEVLEEHFDLTQEEIRQRVLDALGEVRLPRAGKFLSLPQQLSRGEAQRAMLASALLSRPKLLLADEPLTGLDASTSAALLGLLEDMRRKRGMAMVMVTHDLAVVAGIADRVAVVYGGAIVEHGPVRDIFYAPKHPYTAGLLASTPGLGHRMEPIPGDVPDLASLPKGCPFWPRCAHAEPRCPDRLPPPERIGETVVRCIRARELDLPGVPR